MCQCENKLAHCFIIYWHIKIPFVFFCVFCVPFKCTNKCRVKYSIIIIGSIACDNPVPESRKRNF